MVKEEGYRGLSGNTDPYQPTEEKYRVTEQILEVLKEHNYPFAIGTRSDSILRESNLTFKATWFADTTCEATKQSQIISI